MYIFYFVKIINIFNLLCMFQLIFSFGLPLCKQLQKTKLELKEATDLAQDTVNKLVAIRNNCEN